MLQKLAFTDQTLKAVVIVDKDTSKERTIILSVNTQEKKITGTVPELLEGPHTFEVVFTFTTSTGKEVELARGTTPTKEVFIQAGNNPTPVEIKVIRYTDSDRDGFTNLAELEAGADCWENAACKPPSVLVFGSDKYVLSGVVGSSFLRQDTSNSERYTLTSGF